jgi:phosphoglycolate phosphatase
MEGRRVSGEATGVAAWPRAVLFDLDGTLIDSAPDIAAAVNELLGRHRLGPLRLDQVVSMIGNGTRKLTERAFAATSGPLSPDQLDQRYAEMLEIYGRHLTGVTTLLPGAAELVAALRQQGARLGIVTNKPQRFIETILDHFGLAGDFEVVIGSDAGVTPKPAPDMLLAAMEKLGAGPRDTVMVGDSASDVDSARAAGVASVLRRGGYTHTPAEKLGADIVVDRLDEMIGVLPALRVKG